MRRRTTFQPVVTDATLNIDGINRLQSEFPLGEGWMALHLRGEITLTIGTGSGALSHALQRIIENIQLTSDTDGPIIDAPGRALYFRDALLKGTLPKQDTFAASSATYQFHIPIRFADPRTMRPEDTILNTLRYKSLRFVMNVGGVSRLLSTVGTASATGKYSLYIEKIDGPLGDTLQPRFVPYIVAKSAVNPNSQSYAPLELDAMLNYKRLLFFTSDNVDNFQGTEDSAVLKLLTLKDQMGVLGLNGVQDDCVQKFATEYYGLESVISGLYVHDFLGEGASTLAAEAALGKSFFQLDYTTDTPAGKYVHTLIDGYKDMPQAA